MTLEVDIATLELFCEKVDQLFRGSFRTQARQDIGSIVEWKEDKGWDSIYVGPTEESVAAAVLTLRFFIQNNESVSLHNMAALYSDLAVIDNVRRSRWLDLRNRLNAFLDQPTSIAIDEGKCLTHRGVMELFIYGWLAHTNDPQRVQILKAYSQTPYFPVLQAEFAYVVKTVMDGLRQMCMMTREDLNALRAHPGSQEVM